MELRQTRPEVRIVGDPNLPPPTYDQSLVMETTFGPDATVTTVNVSESREEEEGSPNNSYYGELIYEINKNEWAVIQPDVILYIGSCVPASDKSNPVIYVV